MANRDDSENNAKVSDSAYSNSCSNSQSRRSRSSKSTHSGSNSSGSSGYCGQQSTSGSSNNLAQPPKKEKESKKKKIVQTEAPKSDVIIEESPPEAAPTFELPKEKVHDGVSHSSMQMQVDKGVENMDIVMDSDSGEAEVLPSQVSSVTPAVSFLPGKPAAFSPSVGFACVVSLHDGIVMYTTPSLTTALGFPSDMWVGRSFLQFMFSGDHDTFRRQISDGLVSRKFITMEEKVNTLSKIACRLRRYKSLSLGFNVKDRVLSFQAFLLNSSLRNINDGDGKIMYVVMQATPLYSAFKTSREKMIRATPFVIKHTANGIIEYVDPDVVPYMGYLPQDLIDTNVLLLYHPDDLNYLCQVYETVIQEGSLKRSKSYRIKIENGSYVKVESEFSTFICPWSRSVVFITAKNYVIEGPANPDVFAKPSDGKSVKISDDEKNKIQMLRKKIITIMHEVPSKPAEVAKQQISKRCQDLESFMESLMDEQPKTEEELRLEIQEPDHSNFERDSVMLGGISPHHEYNDSKSSTETPLSYTQLNYNETLQRYFESHHPYPCEEFNILAGENIIEFQDKTHILNHCYIPMATNCGYLGEISPTCGVNALPVGSPAPAADYQPIRLTESSLNKHNSEMEKELMKCHRVTRTSSKGERDKTTNETRQKKKEHLARCNVTYQPANTAAATIDPQPHGVKRPSKQTETDGNNHKHLCSSTRQSRRVQPTLSTSATTIPASSTVTTTNASTSHWAAPPVNNMGTFILGVGIPQQMPIINPVSAMPGIFPMYYAPAPSAVNMPVSSNGPEQPSTSAPVYQTPTMPCMMYGQPMYGSPFMYSPINPQMSYPTHQAVMAQSMQYNNTMNPLGLTSRNYEEGEDLLTREF